MWGRFIWYGGGRKAKVPPPAAPGSRCGPASAGLPEPSSQVSLALPGTIMVILGPPWVPGSLGCVGQSCQPGLWCNLPAEPLPELRVPPGVGKLPSATSPACLGASWGAGHPSHPAASPTGSRAGGQAMGEVPRGAPRPLPVAVGPAAPRLQQSCQQPRGHRWTRGPSVTAMFVRKRSVSFGGFGWWVTDGREGEGVGANLAVKPG